MPQRNRGHWDRRLRKRAKLISRFIGDGARDSLKCARSLGFETLENRCLLAVQPFPVPLSSVDPEASLIYRGTVTAAIDVAGETESFTINLDSPQQISILADPSSSLAPTLQILDPSSTSVASTIAAASGENAVLQTVNITTPGSYTIKVAGASGTVGNFSLSLFLNTALEADRVGGPANDTAAVAQSLNSSFLPIGSSGAERGAVVGLGGATGALFSASQTHSNDVFSGQILPYNFSAAPAPIGDGTLTLTAVADLDSSSEYLTLNAEGIFSRNVFVTGGLQQQLVTTTLTIPQAILQQLAADGTISFTVTPSSGVNNLGANYLTLDLSFPTGGGLGALGGWYSFSLDDGQSATIVANSAAPAALQLELYGQDGTTLLTQGVASSSGNLVIDGFTDTTADLLPATYFIRVGSSSEYSLSVTRDAEFDGEPNNDLAPDAQDITLSGVALGFVGSGSPGGSNGVVKVGVLSTISSSVTSHLSLAGMDASAISVGEVQTGSLLTNGYDVLVLGRIYYDLVPQAFVDAVTTFVNMGGGVVTEWDGASYLFDGYHPTYRYSTTNPQSHLLLGQIGSGYDLAYNTPLVKAADHPIWSGLPDQFSAFGGTEYFYTTYGYDTSQIDVIATYQGNGTSQFPNQQFPAVFVGRNVNVVGMPFDWQDEPDDPNLVKLYTNAVLFADDNGGSSDNYSIMANAGDLLTVNTTVPSAGPGEFVNNLDLAIELYDPLGNLVASDATGALTHAATLTGAYTVRVARREQYPGRVRAQRERPDRRTGAFQGDGKHSGGWGCPAHGADSIRDRSLGLGPAEHSRCLRSDDRRHSCHACHDRGSRHACLRLASIGRRNAHAVDRGRRRARPARPVAGCILHAIDDRCHWSQGDRILGTRSRRAGSRYAHLHGHVRRTARRVRSGHLRRATDRFVLRSANPRAVRLRCGYVHAHFAVRRLPEDDYSLTLFSSPTGFHDAAGNLLDGEREPTTTVPSGNGFPGGNFALSFIVDTAVGAFPTPFVPDGPLGSLIYSSGVSGRIAPAADVDQFTVNLDAGQRLSLIVAADFQAVVTVLGPDSSPVATASASAAGDELLVQGLSIDVAGTYTVMIESLGGTFGNYTIDAVLNAFVEQEPHQGPENNDPASAEDLDGSFSAIGSGNAEQGAVVGQGGFNEGPLYDASQTLYDIVSYPNVLQYSFLNTPAPIGDATLILTAIADLDSTSEYLTVNAEGLFSQNVFVIGGQQQELVTAQVTIPLATLAQLAADGTVTFTVTPSNSVDFLGPNQLTLELSYSIQGGSGDWYQFTLEDHQSATIVLSAGDAADVLELYDASGTTRLASAVRSANGLSVIQNFVDRTTDGLPDTYLVRAFVVSPDYQLAITRGADFDVEGDDGFDDAQDIGGINNVLGYLGGPGDEDWHQISVQAGDLLTITAAAPGSGPFEFVNPMGEGLAGGLIISEIVDGTVNDGNPKFVEITNTGNAPFTFVAGGLIVQSNNSTDRAIDVDLSGVTILAGQSYVIATTANDGQAVFEATYGFAADLYVDALLGDGNDRFILTDTADGSHLLDTLWCPEYQRHGPALGVHRQLRIPHFVCREPNWGGIRPERLVYRRSQCARNRQRRVGNAASANIDNSRDPRIRAGKCSTCARRAVRSLWVPWSSPRSWPFSHLATVSGNYRATSDFRSIEAANTSWPWTVPPV